MTISGIFFKPVKYLLKKIPIAFTKNQQYDKQTLQIVKKVCGLESNCIDIGTHEGEILDLFIRQSPAGNHFGFEPLPFLFEKLKQKYRSLPNIHIYPFALSNQNEVAEFNYVISNPAYSGLLKRRYDRPGEQDTKIDVEVKTLDDIIPVNTKIDLIKIDVEGGEINVLKGAGRIMAESNPVIIFEFGMGGSDIYGATPAIMYSFFEEFGYKISLLRNYIHNKPWLSLAELEKEFHTGSNHYFVAYKFIQ